MAGSARLTTRSTTTQGWTLRRRMWSLIRIIPHLGMAPHQEQVSPKVKRIGVANVTALTEKGGELRKPSDYCQVQGVRVVVAALPLPPCPCGRPRRLVLRVDLS